MTMWLSYGRKTAFRNTVYRSLHAAQCAYIIARNASGQGASSWGEGLVFDGDEIIANISYNGRAWTHDDLETRTLIAEAPTMEQIA